MPIPTWESYAPDPEHFSGDAGKCQGFILQCSLVFHQRPRTFPTDQLRVCFVIRLLRGRALAWAEAVTSHQPIAGFSFTDFISELKDVFDHPNHWGDASKRLASLRQGARSVADFSVEFKTLAADAGWDDSALRGTFLNGLSESLQDAIAARDEPADFKTLVSLAIRLDNRLQGRCSQRVIPRPSLTTSHAALPSTTIPAPPSTILLDGEPMQLRSAHLSPAERLRRMRSGACLYCGEPGHLFSTCPVRPKGGAHQ